MESDEKRKKKIQHSLLWHSMRACIHSTHKKLLITACRIANDSSKHTDSYIQIITYTERSTKRDFKHRGLNRNYFNLFTLLLNGGFCFVFSFHIYSLRNRLNIHTAFPSAVFIVIGQYLAYYNFVTILMHLIFKKRQSPQCVWKQKQNTDNTNRTFHPFSAMMRFCVKFLRSEQQKM